MRTRLATDGRKPHSDRALLARLEEVRHADIVQGVGGLVVTVGATTLSVDNTLRNALAVEVGEQVDQVEVLQEQGTVLADSLRFVWVRHRGAIAGGVESILRRGVPVIVVVTVHCKS